MLRLHWTEVGKPPEFERKVLLKLTEDREIGALHFSPPTKCLMVEMRNGKWFRTRPLDAEKVRWSRIDRNVPTSERMTFVRLYESGAGVVYFGTRLQLLQRGPNGEWGESGMIAWYNPRPTLWDRVRDAVVWRLIRAGMS